MGTDRWRVRAAHGLGALATVALAAVLTGCASTEPDPPAPAPAASPTDPGQGDAGRTDGDDSPTAPADVSTLDVDGLTLDVEVTAGTLEVDAPDARSTRLSVTPGDPDRAGAPLPALHLTLPDGAAAAVQLDGTVVVTDIAFALGAAPGAGQRLRVTEGPDRGRAQLVLEVRTAAGQDEPAPVPLELWVGRAAVLSTDWGDREGGLSIAVEPAAWVRSGGMAGVEGVWHHLEENEPDATGPGMRDQLECHAVGAPDKATWKHEPWRPDVGLIRTMAARCNPT